MLFEVNFNEIAILEIENQQMLEYRTTNTLCRLHIAQTVSKLTDTFFNKHKAKSLVLRSFKVDAVTKRKASVILIWAARESLSLQT